VELVATAIETDDEFVSHHRRMSDAERVRVQLAGEPCGHRRAGEQRVQLPEAAHTTGHAVRHDQRHPAASPGKVGAEAGGCHDGSTD
jgi:hypothetical protein